MIQLFWALILLANLPQQSEWRDMALYACLGIIMFGAGYIQSLSKRLANVEADLKEHSDDKYELSQKLPKIITDAVTPLISGLRSEMSGLRSEMVAKIEGLEKKSEA